MAHPPITVGGLPSILSHLNFPHFVRCYNIPLITDYTAFWHLKLRILCAWMLCLCVCMPGAETEEGITNTCEPPCRHWEPRPRFSTRTPSTLSCPSTYVYFVISGGGRESLPLDLFPSNDYLWMVPSWILKLFLSFDTMSFPLWRFSLKENKGWSSYIWSMCVYMCVWHI